MPFSVPATSMANWRDSTTHGPAITKSGFSRPTSNPHNFITGTLCDILHGFIRSRHRLAGFGVGNSSLHKSLEQRMSGTRRRGKFRVELTRHEPRMIGEFDRFAQTVLGRQTA